jgi:zinc protease
MIALALAPTLLAAAPPAPVELPDGMRLIVRERHANPLVAIDLWVRAGAREETPDEYGAAHFLEHTLFKGTTSRKAGEVDDAIESLGGILDAATGPDYAHFYTTVPANRLAPALDILADVMMNATLPDVEVARERGVILDELAQHAADSRDVLVDRLFALAFRQGPYRRSPGGTPADIAARGRDTLAAFYRRCYAPNRASLVLVGDVTPDAAAVAVAHAFGRWRAVARPDRTTIDENRFAPLPVRAVFQGETTAPEIGLAFPAPAAHDTVPCAVARVAASLLGETGLRGRLNSASLSGTQATARFVPRQDATLFLVTAQLRAPAPDEHARGSALDTLEVTLTSAIASLVTAPPNVEELNAAKQALLGQVLFDQETDAGLAHDLGYADLIGGDPPETERARIAQVTSAGVQQFAREWLTASRLLSVRLLPRDEAPRGAP